MNRYNNDSLNILCQGLIESILFSCCKGFKVSSVHHRMCLPVSQNISSIPLTLFAASVRFISVVSSQLRRTGHTMSFSVRCWCSTSSLDFIYWAISFRLELTTVSYSLLLSDCLWTIVDWSGNRIIGEESVHESMSASRRGCRSGNERRVTFSETEKTIIRGTLAASPYLQLLQCTRTCDVTNNLYKRKGWWLNLCVRSKLVRYCH